MIPASAVKTVTWCAPTTLRNDARDSLFPMDSEGLPPERRQILTDEQAALAQSRSPIQRSRNHSGPFSTEH